MIGLTPDITAVSVVRHGVLRLTFADGLVGELEVTGRMRGAGVRDGADSRGVCPGRGGPETGTVVWPGGADLAPDTLYERVRTGLWPDENRAA